ncbi:hypothetical protein B0172_04662 [Mycobacterium avium subsp. paratuberculosis]|nr:hypothetical protein B0172_04662 [Mycobacterium avium subsp. paratuberculosis]
MRIIDEFARRHPDIKVRAVLSGPGVMQQLSTFCVGGRCPDVLWRGNCPTPNPAPGVRW